MRKLWFRRTPSEPDVHETTRSVGEVPPTAFGVAPKRAAYFTATNSKRWGMGWLVL